MFFKFKILYCVFFYTLVFSIAKSQTLVSISNQTVLVAPSQTVTNNSTIYISGNVKNTGLDTITDFVHINLAIDTSSTSSPKYYLRSTTSYFQTKFVPNTTFSFTVQDVVSTINSYHGGGGGTVIIIWAKVGLNNGGNETTADSAFTKIHIIDMANGISDMSSLKESPILLNNPVNEEIYLNYDKLVYTKVEMMNEFGQVQLIESKTIPVADFAKGIYYLRFFKVSDNKVIVKKIIIQ